MTTAARSFSPLPRLQAVRREPDTIPAPPPSPLDLHAMGAFRVDLSTSDAECIIDLLAVGEEE